MAQTYLTPAVLPLDVDGSSEQNTTCTCATVHGKTCKLNLISLRDINSTHTTPEVPNSSMLQQGVNFNIYGHQNFKTCFFVLNVCHFL